MNILFSYRAFDGVAGGVQRMMCVLMNELVRRGHRITLMTWDDANATSFYPIDEKVEWTKISVGDYRRKATLKEKLLRGKMVREHVKAVKPDVIVCFQDGAFFATKPFVADLGIPVILAERNAPHRYDHLKGGKHQNLIFQIYRLADAITIQCESFRQRYPSYLRSKITTIPNPVFPPAPEEAAFNDPLFPFEKVLLSVGRLGYQKNFMPLIRAFAQVSPDAPEWGLVIIGEGEDRAKLEAETAHLGTKNKILMPGTMTDVWKAYRSADLFCLPSRWEGFPNALSEALIRGVPSVGYAESAGVCDLILHEKNGMLAANNGDVDSLAAVLRPLMQDDAFREALSQKAPQTMEPYAPDLMFDKWETLLITTGTKRAS
jgi:glycosyltransferase involved in cell wall biosynthesis